MDEYSTSDIYEASSLVAAGIHLLRVDPGFNGRKEFIFEDSKSVSKAINDYVNASLTVNVQTFIGAWRRLRRAVDGNGDMRHERYNHRR